MTFADLARRAVQLLAVLLLLSALNAAHAEPANSAKPPCNAPLDLVQLANPLTNVARKVSAGEPVTIVAIGSSSTAGAGASSPAGSYPSRLAVELQTLFPKQKFTVLNKGVNGETVPDMLRRFDDAVIANKPDLVLWQLGTNSLLRDHPVRDSGASIRDGLNRMRAAGADVVLVDPQFAPAVIAKPHAAKMVNFIASLSKEERVGLFRRFDVMKRWREVDHIPMSGFIIADGLHMNDWGYACMAKGLGVAIADAVTRPIVSAKAAAAAPASAGR